MRDKGRVIPVWAALVCLLAAGIGLLFCSQCSPLYPINVWGDANCLLTVGRVMKAGGVVYRDIYEQKGPTLYLLHMLAAQVSDTSFLGVYVLEVAAFAASLFFAWRIAYRHAAGEYGRAWPALAATVLMGACVLTGAAFSRGDSAEEFCLPLLLAAMDTALGAYERRAGPMPMGRLLLCGLLAGLVATIKYTLLGLFIGLCVCEGVLALREGGVVRALKSAGAFLAGMLLPVLAWGAYFAAHGALADAVSAYLINNIFLYSAQEALTLRDVLRMARNNALWAVPAAMGCAALCLNRRERASVRACAAAMAAGQFVTVFLLGRVWPYSALALAPFAALGVRQALRGMANAARRWKALVSVSVRRGLCAAAFVAAAALAWAGTPNAPLRGQELEELAQGRLSAFIEEGATLLQYNHLDDGLYLTSGTLPQQKYFVRLNVDLEEMVSELDRYVREAIPDYVLTSWRELPSEFDRYQLVAEDVGYDDANRLNKMLYLYRRKGE